MLSSSDFNDAVSKFTNGNYAANPLDPLYIEEPASTDYNRGVEPLQTLPAQWWNWFVNQFTLKFNNVNTFVKNIFDELSELLSLVGVTPDATESEITTGQIKDVFETKYPNFISKFIHTIAQMWSYTGVVVDGDITTTQTTRLAVFEHKNESDASTTPATETDEYETKYVEKLPIKLGGTNADNAQDAIENLCADVGTSVSMTTSNEVLFMDNGEVKKAEVGVLADVVTQSQDPRVVKSRRARWLRFDFTDANHQSVKIDADTRITYPGGTFTAGSSGYSKSMAANMITSAGANSEGKDFCVYLVPAENEHNGDIVCSVLQDAPIDIDAEYTADKVLKIGRFHTVCVDVGNPTMILPASPNSGLTTSDFMLVKPYRQDSDPDFYAFYHKQISAKSTGSYYDVITVPHPLAGFLAGQILPESVWCLTFKPDTRYEDAMVYEKTTDTAIDVYLQIGTGENTRSMYSVGTGPTRNRQQQNHQADMLAVGKRLLNDDEFTAAALGSNEKTAIYGAAESSIASSSGGHVDTASRRMISAIGCEDMCGAIWQWLRDVSANGSSGFSTYDGQASMGQTHGTSYALSAGGDWPAGASCGSRSRAGNNARSNVPANNGGRGSSRVIREAE